MHAMHKTGDTDGDLWSLGFTKSIEKANKLLDVITEGVAGSGGDLSRLLRQKPARLLLHTAHREEERAQLRAILHEVRQVGDPTLRLLLSLTYDEDYTWRVLQLVAGRDNDEKALTHRALDFVFALRREAGTCAPLLTRALQEEFNKVIVTSGQRHSQQQRTSTTDTRSTAPHLSMEATPLSDDDDDMATIRVSKSGIPDFKPTHEHPPMLRRRSVSLLSVRNCINQSDGGICGDSVTNPSWMPVPPPSQAAQTISISEARKSMRIVQRVQIPNTPPIPSPKSSDSVFKSSSDATPTHASTLSSARTFSTSSNPTPPRNSPTTAAPLVSAATAAATPAPVSTATSTSKGEPPALAQADPDGVKNSRSADMPTLMDTHRHAELSTSGPELRLGLRHNRGCRSPARHGIALSPTRVRHCNTAAATAATSQSAAATGAAGGALDRGKEVAFDVRQPAFCSLKQQRQRPNLPVLPLGDPSRPSAGTAGTTAGPQAVQSATRGAGMPGRSSTFKRALPKKGGSMIITAANFPDLADWPQLQRPDTNTTSNALSDSGSPTRAPPGHSRHKSDMGVQFLKDTQAPRGDLMTLQLSPRGRLAVIGIGSRGTPASPPRGRDLRGACNSWRGLLDSQLASSSDAVEDRKSPRAHRPSDIIAPVAPPALAIGGVRKNSIQVRGSSSSLGWLSAREASDPFLTMPTRSLGSSGDVYLPLPNMQASGDSHGGDVGGGGGGDGGNEQNQGTGARCRTEDWRSVTMRSEDSELNSSLSDEGPEEPRLLAFPNVREPARRDGWQEASPSIGHSRSQARKRPSVVSTDPVVFTSASASPPVRTVGSRIGRKDVSSAVVSFEPTAATTATATATPPPQSRTPAHTSSSTAAPHARPSIRRAISQDTVRWQLSKGASSGDKDDMHLPRRWQADSSSAAATTWSYSVKIGAISAEQVFCSRTGAHGDASNAGSQLNGSDSPPPPPTPIDSTAHRPAGVPALPEPALLHTMLEPMNDTTPRRGHTMPMSLSISPHSGGPKQAMSASPSVENKVFSILQRSLSSPNPVQRPSDHAVNVLLRQETLSVMALHGNIRHLGCAWLKPLLASSISKVRKSAKALYQSGSLAVKDGTRMLQSCLNHIAAAAHTLPLPIRAVAFAIEETAQLYTPNHVNTLVGGFIVLRLINPAVALPHNHGLLAASSPLDDKAARFLVFLAKVLQKLANDDQLEGASAAFNTFLSSDNRQTMYSFLSAAAMPNEEGRFERPLRPWTDLPISQEHVTEARRMLDEVEGLSDLQPTASTHS